jgi:FAD/FMN-containing dehydrogenase
MLQAKHGFAADNLLSARVVLADGYLETASESENIDLFWALRGAGHNFGIVTSFEVKTTDVTEDGWTMLTFTFSQDRLEELLDTWNQLEVDYREPGMLVLNGLIIRNPSVDAEHVGLLCIRRLCSDLLDLTFGSPSSIFRSSTTVHRRL